MRSNCPFCKIYHEGDNHRIVAMNELALVLKDGFPLTKGHSLIIPKRHVASFFETTNEERHALLQLLDQAKASLDKVHTPDSYNIGINDGPFAGQTVDHLHIHLIPRYTGDAPDPRGGIRWIIPEKADYWSGNR